MAIDRSENFASKPEVQHPSEVVRSQVADFKASKTQGGATTAGSENLGNASLPSHLDTSHGDLYHSVFAANLSNYGPVGVMNSKDFPSSLPKDQTPKSPPPKASEALTS